MAVPARTHSTHWGTFTVAPDHATDSVTITPLPSDPDPSPLLGNIPSSLRHPARIAQPMIRAGWLECGPGPSDRRGREPFVPVSWDEALTLAAEELARVYRARGPAGVYGGSYGWASAGRFHHAQSQLHRFLNVLGGYVKSVNSYSMGASGVLWPHIVGFEREMFEHATSWPLIVAHTELVVAFGGMPLKNANVNPGGLSAHVTGGYLREAAARGVKFVLVSPVRDDLPEDVDAEWLPIIPGTDVAYMLGLAYVLIEEGLVDRAFLDRYTTGYARFAAYVRGDTDGTPKTPEWAATQTGLAADRLRDLARQMAASRTMVTVTWSLQRIRYGEQNPWLGLTLAAMLGQLGLPGGGFGFGYAMEASVGTAPALVPPPTFGQGRNPHHDFIPVARIADMLLHPGAPYDYNGERRTYPEIDLVYWVGGNPFHHHQDLNRLRRAFARPATVIVNEPYWTGMARHADIVFPVTVSLERDDIGAAKHDPLLIAMRQVVPPFAAARDDYAVFAGMAERLGVADAFTEGRSTMDWLRHLYAEWSQDAARRDIAVPEFDAFWDSGLAALPAAVDDLVLFGDFRADPVANALATPSGKVEIFSERIASFGYDDCPGHATWLEPDEWLQSPRASRYPLHLIANNPATRLHSQLDMGAYSQASKIQGREPLRLHPNDAAARGISDGDVVRVFNDRGACLAGVIISDAVRPGVVQLSTGAWYDPLDPEDPQALCVHGNPNVLTRDSGTSRLAQGCIGQHALVEIERWTAPLPPLRAFDPPPTVSRDALSL